MWYGHGRYARHCVGPKVSRQSKRCAVPPTVAQRTVCSARTLWSRVCVVRCASNSPCTSDKPCILHCSSFAVEGAKLTDQDPRRAATAQGRNLYTLVSAHTHVHRCPTALFGCRERFVPRRGRMLLLRQCPCAGAYARGPKH